MAATLLGDDAVTKTMHHIYKRETPKQHFTRQGRTTRWFNPKGEMYQGERWHFKAYIGAPNAARVNTMAAVRADSYELPPGRKIEAERLSYDYDDLRVLEVTVEVNDWAEELTNSREEAVWNAATKLVTEARLDYKDRANKLCHQDTTVTLAKAASVAYDVDGTATSTTTAYLPIDEGSIAMFTRNMLIDIRTGGASGTVRVSAFVKSVCADGKGPWNAGARVAGFDGTYGIVVAYDATASTASSAADADFGNVADGDEICFHLELDVGFLGLPAWFSPGTNVYYDHTGSAINRDSGTAEWQIPHFVDGGTSSANADIDMEDHFDALADFLPDLVAVGRERRISDRGGNDPTKGIFWQESLLAVGRQDLINDAVSDAADSIRFTTVASTSLSDAEKKYLTGVVGFDGVVYRNPTMGHITMQADPVCTPNRLYILDPQSWGFLTLKGGIKSVNWIPNDNGGMYHRQLGTNNRVTYGKTASACTAMLLYSDQPQANAMIQYIKSSRRAS